MNKKRNFLSLYYKLNCFIIVSLKNKNYVFNY